METQILTTMLNLLKEAMEWLQNLYEAARKGGLPPFSLTPEKAAIGLTSAHRNGSGQLDDETLREEYRKMLTRNRVRRWRERQKRKQALAVTGNANGAANTENSVTGNANWASNNENRVTGNAKNVTCNAETAETLQPVTPCNAFAKKEKENEKRKKQRKEINKNKKKKTISLTRCQTARAHVRKPAAVFLMKAAVARPM